MLVERSSDKPIYFTSSLSIDPRFTDGVAELLRAEHRAATFVNSRGRYRSIDDWRRRWAAEHRNYGAAIILTVGEPTDDDPEREGDGIRGAHFIDHSVWNEARDIARLSRPLLWVPYWRSQLRYVARFVIDCLDRAVSMSRCSRLYPAADAVSLCPEIINPLAKCFVVMVKGDGSH
jgi:hypothetical protein